MAFTETVSAADGQHAMQRHRLLLWVLLTGFTYGLVEITAWGGLKLLPLLGYRPEPPAPELALSQRHRERIRGWIDPGGQYFMHSSSLGWTVRANGSAYIFMANSQGIRADREYTPDPPPGKIRLAGFGDSFTHGAEVDLEATWENRIEAMDPGLEVLNFGVDAYGLDQSYLRYLQDGSRFDPHIVLIGFMSENINRAVNVFRPFYQPQTGAPFVKPRYRLEGDGLALVPSPISGVEAYQTLLDDTETTLRRLGVNDHYYQVRYSGDALSRLPSRRLWRAIANVLSGKDPLAPGFRDGRYDTGSEAYRITEKLIDQFYMAALDRNALPVILIYPDRKDMLRHDSGKPQSYKPLIDHLENSGYGWIDLRETLSGIAPDERFLERGHYTPAGNNAVARAVLDYMKTQNLDTVAEIGQRLDSERSRFATGSLPSP